MRIRKNVIRLIIAKRYVCAKCGKQISKSWYDNHKGLPTIICKDCEELHNETNLKFIQRIENMLYSVCGCDTSRGKEVLEECLKRNGERKNAP